MNNPVEVFLPPEEAFDDERVMSCLFRQLRLDDDGSKKLKLLKRSIDARGKRIKVRFQVQILPIEDLDPPTPQRYQDVTRARQVVIVGSGPAGLFAALRLIELGIKPIVLERGKDVQSRRRDLAAINKDQIVNPESNYCFGEGGAGTYSDGKLYTRSNKRGDVGKILEVMVAHGATEEILYDAHPHIGTNKLPKLVVALRDTIRAAGGQVLFDAKVVRFLIKGDETSGVILSDGTIVEGESVILATGHSARDIFEALFQQKITIEAKPFALGVRVEHSQSLIDRIQYHCLGDRGPYLPASSYSLVHQAHENGIQRGVFSFCMCPGGFIVPAATAPGEIVVNGMSPSRRDSKFANSGIVVAVNEHDFKSHPGREPLSAMDFQASVEQRACAMAGGTQRAPAQRLVDFVTGKVSSTLPESSYQPGLESVNLQEVLPSFITDILVQGFRNFGTRMVGYLTNDAQIVGVESRTSSPVRIPRKEDGEHIHLKRLFPCGEGAGYAGGIVSAAMDGERIAEAVCSKYIRNENIR